MSLIFDHKNMRGDRRVADVVSTKGCTAMLSEAASFSFRKNNINNFRQSPDSDHHQSLDDLPFSNLVICITGLSKDTKRQVKEATEKLGGVYSPDLHSRCTHLVLQSTNERTFDDRVIKRVSSVNGGLSVVTIGWFVDSVRRKVRLSEELYSIKQIGTKIRKFNADSGSVNSNRDGENRGGLEEWPLKKTTGFILAGKCLYIDPDISPLEHKKVLEAGCKEGMTFLKKWSAGCAVDYVVCEGASVGRYLGHCRMSILVTPAWILKTAKAGKTQKLVHMSEDLAKHVQTMLEHSHVNNSETCPTRMLQETPRYLLDSICWNISDPPISSASKFVDSCSTDLSGNEASIFESVNEDAKSELSSRSSFSRLLNESEKSEMILRTQILTILFPVDRYSEMGPSSRSFYSENGFTCLQVLNHIHSFYQENLTDTEIEIAIRTDSRQAQLLRSFYPSTKAMTHGSVKFKRLEFLGSRKKLEMLKRATGNTYTSVYELLLKA